MHARTLHVCAVAELPFETVHKKIFKKIRSPVYNSGISLKVRIILLFVTLFYK